MYIVKHEGRIIDTGDNKEELETLYINDTVEESEVNYTRYKGEYYTDEQLEEIKKAEEEQKANTVTLDTLKAQNEELKAQNEVMQSQLALILQLLQSK